MTIHVTKGFEKSHAYKFILLIRNRWLDSASFSRNFILPLLRLLKPNPQIVHFRIGMLRFIRFLFLNFAIFLIALIRYFFLLPCDIALLLLVHVLLLFRGGLFHCLFCFIMYFRWLLVFIRFFTFICVGESSPFSHSLVFKFSKNIFIFLLIVLNCLDLFSRRLFWANNLFTQCFFFIIFMIRFFWFLWLFWIQRKYGYLRIIRWVLLTFLHPEAYYIIKSLSQHFFVFFTKWLRQSYSTSARCFTEYCFSIFS